MKLQSRYSKVFLLVAIPAYLVISIIYYFLTFWVITNKADESLIEDKQYIIEQIKESDKIVNLFLNLSDDYHLRSVDKRHPVKDQFNTVMIYDENEQEEEPYRQLFTIIDYKGNFFELTIRKSLVEYNSLVYSIIFIGVIFLGLLTLGFTLINRFLTKKIWSPFYRTIHMLDNYNPDLKETLWLESSNTDEFELLNTAVLQMTKKIREDFSRQKQFIDHVAHETQTPLAIINANIDLLIQKENLTESDFRAMQNVTETSSRLSKVIKSLLLLSRIENNQFSNTRQINLTNLIVKYLENNEEQLAEKRIKVEAQLNNTFCSDLDPILAEILVSNICQNAIRHNVPNGKIIILSDLDNLEKGQLLRITNTGLKSTVNPSDLLKKFVKNSTHPDSTGLGLTLVAQICNAYDIKIDYEIEGNLHIISLRYLF